MAGGAGFTGTRKGMTKKQRIMFRVLLVMLLTNGPAALDHGDCVGADDDAHKIARKLSKKWQHILIRVHPPTDNKHRAFNKGDFDAPPKPYLDRNKDIVNNTNFLIATPGEFEPQLRSGTWSTIRYGIKQGKNVYVIYPDGTVYLETKLFKAKWERPKMKKVA